MEINKTDEQQENKNSIYRKYYQCNTYFHINVIKNEPAPY